MSEASWIGELSISVMGLESVGLGKIHLVKLEARKPHTCRVCPKCGKVPKRNKQPPMYHCEKCKLDYKTWHGLKQAIPIDKKSGLVIPDRQTVKVEKASVSLLNLKNARGLVTKHEYGVVCLDEKARKNMQKVGAMLKEFKKAIVFELVFMQNGDRHLFYLAVADDNTLRAREIIPMNKVKQFPNEIEVFVEDSKVSGKDLKQLMNAIPEIKVEDLTIETEFDKLSKRVEKATPDIEKIIQKMKED